MANHHNPLTLDRIPNIEPTTAIERVTDGVSFWGGGQINKKIKEAYKGVEVAPKDYIAYDKGSEGFSVSSQSI